MSDTSCGIARTVSSVPLLPGTYFLLHLAIKTPSSRGDCEKLTVDKSLADSRK